MLSARFIASGIIQLLSVFEQKKMTLTFSLLDIEPNRDLSTPLRMTFRPGRLKAGMRNTSQLFTLHRQETSRGKRWLSCYAERSLFLVPIRDQRKVKTRSFAHEQAEHADQTRLKRHGQHSEHRLLKTAQAPQCHANNSTCFQDS